MDDNSVRASDKSLANVLKTVRTGLVPAFVLKALAGAERESSGFRVKDIEKKVADELNKANPLLDAHKETNCGTGSFYSLLTKTFPENDLVEEQDGLYSITDRGREVSALIDQEVRSILGVGAQLRSEKIPISVRNSRATAYENLFSFYVRARVNTQFPSFPQECKRPLVNKLIEIFSARFNGDEADFSESRQDWVPQFEELLTQALKAQVLAYSRINRVKFLLARLTQENFETFFFMAIFFSPALWFTSDGHTVSEYLPFMIVAALAYLVMEIVRRSTIFAWEKVKEYRSFGIRAEDDSRILSFLPSLIAWGSAALKLTLFEAVLFLTSKYLGLLSMKVFSTLDPMGDLNNLPIKWLNLPLGAALFTYPLIMGLLVAHFSRSHLSNILLPLKHLHAWCKRSIAKQEINSISQFIETFK